MLNVYTMKRIISIIEAEWRNK